MYVRTKYNDYCNMVAIRKINEIDDDNTFWIDDNIIDTYGDEQNHLSKEDIVKSNENIIRLIEVGDYVNGYRVTLICEDEVHPQNRCLRVSGRGYLWQKDIKSVVTKEQFESIKYEVE